MLNSADQFALEWTESFIDLGRMSNYSRVRVSSMMRVLQEDLTEAIERADLAGIPSESRRRRRLERLIRDVKKTIARSYKTAAKRLDVGERAIIAFAQSESVRIINKVFTVNIAHPTITQVELKALLDRDVVLGEPAADWWRGQAEGTRRRFARQMRMGVLNGETNQQLVQRLRGKATGRTIRIQRANGTWSRVREFKGGVMGISTNQADSLVRTSVQSVSNKALMETYKDNANVLKGYQALTTLDDRTTHICMARTGAAWGLDGAPLPESSVSEGFPGPPPWHFRCRTILSPITKSWDELAAEAGGKDKKLLNTVPDSTRSSMDGLITNRKVHTFGDWLKIKGDAFARNKLGPGRFDLWKSGKITLAQLVDGAGNSRTLTELAAL